MMNVYDERVLVGVSRQVSMHKAAARFGIEPDLTTSDNKRNPTPSHPIPSRLIQHTGLAANAGRSDTTACHDTAPGSGGEYIT